jgi:hypothetical protein
LALQVRGLLAQLALDSPALTEAADHLQIIAAPLA